MEPFFTKDITEGGGREKPWFSMELPVPPEEMSDEYLEKLTRDALGLFSKLYHEGLRRTPRKGLHEEGGV